MLTRIIVSASLAVFVATQAPAMLASGTESKAAVAQPVSSHPTSHISTSAKLEAGRDGHFSGRFVLNGRAVDAVIDTGATFVALNESVAREIGIRSEDLIYNYTVATAAGDIKAARVTVASLSLGDVSMKNVDALVVRENALPSALIGMSFLGRLSSYSVAGGTINLIQ